MLACSPSTSEVRERVAADLALEFKARGYRVVCFAFHGSSGPLRDELERAGIRCLNMDYAGVKLQPRPLVYWWRLWRMLAANACTLFMFIMWGALMLVQVSPLGWRACRAW